MQPCKIGCIFYLIVIKFLQNIYKEGNKIDILFIGGLPFIIEREGYEK